MAIYEDPFLGIFQVLLVLLLDYRIIEWLVFHVFGWFFRVPKRTPNSRGVFMRNLIWVVFGGMEGMTFWSVFAVFGVPNDHLWDQRALSHGFSWHPVTFCCFWCQFLVTFWWSKRPSLGPVGFIPWFFMTPCKFLQFWYIFWLLFHVLATVFAVFTLAIIDVLAIRPITGPTNVTVNYGKYPSVFTCFAQFFKFLGHFIFWPFSCFGYGLCASHCVLAL